MTAILSWLASLLSGPIARSVLDGYKARLDPDNTTERIAAELAARELDVQAREIEATRQLRIAQVGHWATHIPTADYRILPLGTAYMTDAGRQLRIHHQHQEGRDAASPDDQYPIWAFRGC